MEWQSEEFGSSHKGIAGVLLEDGTEPKPAVVLTSNSGGNARQTSELRAYNGRYGNPRAEYVRGSCSCGWRGASRYPVQWDADATYPEPSLPTSLGPVRTGSGTSRRSRPGRCHCARTSRAC